MLRTEAIRVEERVCGTIGGRRVAQACQLGWVFGEPGGEGLVGVERVRDELRQPDGLEQARRHAASEARPDAGQQRHPGTQSLAVVCAL